MVSHRYSEVPQRLQVASMAKDDESGTCFRCLRWFVFAFNLLFWIVGLGMLVIGLWLWFDPVYVTLSSDPKTSVYLLVVAGVIVALLGFLGCTGALRESPCLLTTFFLVLFVVFVLQLVAGVLAFQHQDKLKSWLEESMYDIIYNKYGPEPGPSSIIDSMQSGLECCGVHTYRDWLHSYFAHGQSGSIGRQVDIGIGSWSFGDNSTRKFTGSSGIGSVPHSCCNALGLRDFPTPPDAQRSQDDRASNVCGVSFNKAPLSTYEIYLHKEGCSNALYAKLWSHLDIVIGLCVIVGAIELLSMVLTMLLCCNISKRNAEELKHGGYY